MDEQIKDKTKAKSKTLLRISPRQLPNRQLPNQPIASLQLLQ